MSVEPSRPLLGSLQFLHREACSALSIRGGPSVACASIHVQRCPCWEWIHRHTRFKAHCLCGALLLLPGPKTPRNDAVVPSFPKKFTQARHSFLKLGPGCPTFFPSPISTGVHFVCNPESGSEGEFQVSQNKTCLLQFQFWAIQSLSHWVND